VSTERNSAKEGFRRLAPAVAAVTLMLLGAVLFLGTATGHGKEKKPQTRTISGVVSDDAENPIAGAMVELTDLQTSKVLDIYSQEGGQYQFADLSFSHDYTVKATYKGSSSEVRQVSSIEMRTRLVLNLTIPKTNK
jgi:hypothetical protein